MKFLNLTATLLSFSSERAMPGTQPEARPLKLALSALLPVFLLLAMSANPAQAHKVNIFATVEAGNITGEGYFGSGTKAQNTLVEVRDALDGLVGTTRTDTEGAFRLPVPPGARLPLRVVLKAGDGHQNDYPVTAADLSLPPGAESTPLAGTPPASNSAATVSPAVAGAAPPAPGMVVPSTTATVAVNASGGPAPSPATPTAAAGTMDRSPPGEAMAALVEAAVAKAVEGKIAPLRMEINRLSEINEKAKVRDIVGGLGWIVGLFGLLAVLRGRKK